MKIKHIMVSTILSAILLMSTSGLVLGETDRSSYLGTGITYQGQVKMLGAPFSGECDFQFLLYEDGDVSPDDLAISIVYKNGVSVTDGYFTVQLEFGQGIFNGNTRWMEIWVGCPAGGGATTQMLPRQLLAAVPYALALPGLWTKPNATSPNLVGGNFANWVSSGVVGAVISGGGESGYLNRVTDNYSVVGGGKDNQAGNDTGTASDAQFATVGGGLTNRASAVFTTVAGGYSCVASVDAATVGGGYVNTASANSATISGGIVNTASGAKATVGGGWSNNAASQAATIGGGEENTASSTYATIAGGRQGLASAVYTTICGGYSNTASLDAATVGGGYDNTASGNSATVAGGASNTAIGWRSTVGGGSNNVVSGYLATIAGGGYADNANPTTTANRATDDYCTIGGGGNNQAGNGITSTTDAVYATVSGGKNNDASSSYSMVGGGLNNDAAGEMAAILGGLLNQATFAYTTVGGGFSNLAGNQYATVGGGEDNTASGDSSTVGGGYHNIASALEATVGGGGSNAANGDNSTISGGLSNVADWAYAAVGGGYQNNAGNTYATIGGGGDNLVGGTYATIGGGYYNTATGGYSTVSGGDTNTASGFYSTVGGGSYNIASGYASVVPGGLDNIAQGNYSFAAGESAQALAARCFVWSGGYSVECNTIGQWVAEAPGGVYFYTDDNESSGSYLAADGSSWNSVSNRELKENFTPVDSALLLERLSQTPITSWNYKSQDESIRHVGLMADEFNSLIAGLGGEGLDHINSLDADGVALAAIQGLYAENQALKAENASQQTQIDNLAARLAALEQGETASMLSQIRLTSCLPWLIVVGLFLGGGGFMMVRKQGGGRWTKSN